MKNNHSNKRKNSHFFLDQIEATDEKQYGKLLRKILESAPDSMLIVNQQGKIIFANGQSEKAFGYTQAEMLGNPIEILIPESYREKHAQHVQNYFEHAYTRPMGAGLNLVAERKNKEIFPVEISIAPIEIKDELIALAAVRDISERKKSQAKIDALNQQVLNSAKIAGMAEVANSISHYLGNLLNSANISVELLLGQMNQSDYIRKMKHITDLIEEHIHASPDFFTKDEKGKLIPAYLKSAVAILEKEFEKMNQTTQELQQQLCSSIDVVIRQNEMSKISLYLEPVLLSDVLIFAINMCEIKDIEVIIQNELDNAFVLNTDKIKLLQILSSLLMNAKESLLKCDRADKRITIAIQKADHHIQIAIQDNGIGISKENLKRLFSFGFSTKHQSYGFGLHHSFLLVKELNGLLECSSDGEGKGALFVLTLPY